MARRRDSTYDYLRVAQVHKTLRTAFVCITIIACVCAIAWSVAKVAESPEWWLMIAIALVAPSGVIVTLIKLFRRYVRKNNSRVTQLELRIDPKRTSSGLKPDGSSEDV